MFSSLFGFVGLKFSRPFRRPVTQRDVSSFIGDRLTNPVRILFVFALLAKWGGRLRRWRDNDSCSVYGTGRIHCESSLSVNYHRAINRAEKEPLGNGRPRRLPLLSSARGCGGRDATDLPQLRELQLSPGASSTRSADAVPQRVAAQTLLFFAHFGTSTFLLLYIYFEQLCVVPI